jgi:hypothetical protein
MPIPALVGTVLVNVLRSVAAKALTLINKLPAYIKGALGAFVYELIDKVVDWLEGLKDDEDVQQAIKDELNRYIVQIADEQLHVRLDPADPLSKQSIAIAVGERIGMTLDQNDPFSKTSIGNAIAQKLNLNVVFRDIADKDLFIEDLTWGIRNEINARLGTNFVKIYPADAELIDEFKNELRRQIEAAFEGRPSLFQGEGINMIVSKVQEYKGAILPMNLTQTQKARDARYYSRRYYDRQIRAGYQRVWQIDPNFVPPPPPPPDDSGGGI